MITPYRPLTLATSRGDTAEAQSYEFLYPLYWNAPEPAKVVLAQVNRTLRGIAEHHASRFIFLADAIEAGCDAAISIKLAGRPLPINLYRDVLSRSASLAFNRLLLGSKKRFGNQTYNPYWYRATRGEKWCAEMCSVGFGRPAKDLIYGDHAVAKKRLTTVVWSTAQAILVYLWGFGRYYDPTKGVGDTIQEVVYHAGHLLDREGLCDLLRYPWIGGMSFKSLSKDFLARLDEGIATLLVPWVYEYPSHDRRVIKDTGALRVLAAAGLRVCGVEAEDCTPAELLDKVQAAGDTQVALDILKHHNVSFRRDATMHTELLEIPDSLLPMIEALLESKGAWLVPRGGDRYTMWIAPIDVVDVVAWRGGGRPVDHSSGHSPNNEEPSTDEGSE